MVQRWDVYEKLGTFYLGRLFDQQRGEPTSELCLYDSKDLVTHAVIVGMTGSGKTGLGVTLLEEAAIDGLPTIVIDPKGDMANLALTFPELRSEDLRPWISPDDAARYGQTVEQRAEDVATKWRNGLDEWEQPLDRIRRLREAADVTIYTPASDAGVPVSIVGKFAAPSDEVRGEADLYRDHLATTATSLMTLLGKSVDPVRSREHILLTLILDEAWQRGEELDLARLITRVQQPPLERVGAMDVDSFFPAADRFEFAMALNGLLASPSFKAWTVGQPLNLDRMLYTESGRPRMAIFSIAHLSDSERMFFVSLLLNGVLSWIRSRPGTTSLRALLYIDELFGYLPPVAEPPSKRPLLTLLKQARAFGLGIVLATQNPVDLDYKALANAGTWFLGRLQTERDRARVLDGLEGVSTAAGESFDRAAMSELLGGLRQRVFLLHNVHQAQPEIFQTRWTLSYLAGPVTRNQLKQLRLAATPAVANSADANLSAAAEPGSSSTATTAEIDASTDLSGTGGGWRGGSDVTGSAPVVAPGVSQVYLPMEVTFPRAGAGTGAEWVYRPRLLGLVKIHYVDSRRGLSADRSVGWLAEFPAGTLPVDWQGADELDLEPRQVSTRPERTAGYGRLPAVAGQVKNYAAWGKQLVEHVYRTSRYVLWSVPDLGLCSQPGETESDFRLRIGDRIREARDAEVEKLRVKYASRLQTLVDRERRAAQKVEVESDQAAGAKLDTAITFGAAVLNWLGGRRSRGGTLGRATTAARGATRANRQSADVRRAEENLASVQEQRRELEEQVQREIESLAFRFDPLAAELTEIELKPRKTDVQLLQVALAWVPSSG
ncbi:MAG: DUF87 domain-containing protein [Pirellulales bacterium]